MKKLFFFVVAAVAIAGYLFLQSSWLDNLSEADRGLYSFFVLFGTAMYFMVAFLHRASIRNTRR